MPSNKINFTTTAVDKLRFPEDCTKPNVVYWDLKYPGLGLRLSKTGKKTYFYKRRVKGTGKERSITVGEHGDPVKLPDGTVRTFPFGAQDARDAADELRSDLKKGTDPVAEKQRKREEAAAQAIRDKAVSTTLRQVMEHYFEHHRVKSRPLRPKTKRDYLDFMERNFATWLDKPVAGITRSMCVEKITEIGNRARSQAHKATVYLRLFLNYARDLHESEDGEFPILAVNPAERSKKITKTHAPDARTRALPLNKIGAVWLTLRRRAENSRNKVERSAADWISTILLTGWRLTESGALQWSYVNLEAKTITLPGDVKPKDEHLFAGVKNHNTMAWPMSDALYEILKARAELDSKDATYVFPSVGEKTPYMTDARATIKAIAMVAGCYEVVDKKTKVLLSPHDLRRTFDAVAEECKIGADVKRRLTNHISGDVHFKHYTGTQAFGAAVNAIANYVLDAAAVAKAQESGANVISLAERKAGKPA